MSAYLFADVEVHDHEAFGEYQRGVGPSLEKFGGKALLIGREFEVLEGDWKPSGFVLVEFPDKDALMRWYDSDEYKELKELRQRITRSRLVTMVGV